MDISAILYIALAAGVGQLLYWLYKKVRKKRDDSNSSW